MGNYLAPVKRMAKKPEPPLRYDESPSVACPHCAAHTARVRGVATAKGARFVNITMHCTECQASWVVQKEIYHDEGGILAR